MSVSAGRFIILAFVAVTACGGRFEVDGADTNPSIAGGGGMAGSGAGAARAGSGATASSGAAQGVGGGSGAISGASSGVTAECPLPDSDLNGYYAIDGEGCTNVGAVCQNQCRVACYCEAAGDAPRWNCVTYGCIPK